MALTTKLALVGPGDTPRETNNAERPHVLLACFHSGLSSYWTGDSSLETTE